MPTMSKTDAETNLLAAWAQRLQNTLATGQQDPQAAASVHADGPPSDLRADLRAAMLTRVATSVAAHREYLTVRRERSAWTEAAPGVRLRLLRRDAQFEVDILELADGAALPAVDKGCAQELLLLDGALVDNAQGVLSAALPAFSHAVLPPPEAAAPPELRACGSTQVYRRRLRGPMQTLPAIQAQWWQTGFEHWTTRGFTRPQRWIETGPGVQVLPLCTQGHVVSMLVRFEAGARVPDHGHAIDEDCLVLQGEMFLGDILLRAGDYQLAPAGGSHFDENSDIGVCFYFHGALDDALRGARHP